MAGWLSLVCILVLAVPVHAAFSETCPSEFPICVENNVCKQCHPSCEYCLVSTDNPDEEKRDCGPEDCVSCPEGLSLFSLYNYTHGACVRPTDRVLESVPADQRGKMFVINLERRPYVYMCSVRACFVSLMQCVELDPNGERRDNLSCMLYADRP